jgi:hypothetical protein
MYRRNPLAQFLLHKRIGLSLGNIAEDAFQLLDSLILLSLVLATGYHYDIPILKPTN